MTSMTIQQALVLAQQHHNAGRLQEAESLYRQVLAQRPDNPFALYLLGSLACQANRDDLALDLIRKAIASSPDFAEAHASLGTIFARRGKLDEAIASFERAIALKPDFAEAFGSLGNALKTQGRFDEAVVRYQQVLALQPGNFVARNNIGNVLTDRGQLAEAIASYEKALAIEPKYAEAHQNLGNALQLAGRIDESIACYRRALELQPNFVEARNNLGNALLEKGQLDESILVLRQALALRPDFVEAHNTLGSALRAQGQTEAAIHSFERAITLQPEFVPAYSNLGVALLAAGRADDAILSYQKALTLKPDLVDAHNNLGNALLAQGKVAQAIASYRRAIELKPEFAAAHSNLLYAMHFDSAFDPDERLQEHLLWDARYGQPLKATIKPHANDRSPDRRLKIGYVSADFRAHSVAYFLHALLSHHDRNATEIFCYSDVQRCDEVTSHLQQLVPHWRNIAGLSHERVAEQIRRDQIDILVDLAGHTSGNRLLVFARKPAPIQVTYLGYPNTTGLSTMDYRFTDRHADPPGIADPFYGEQLLRLPRTFLCFHPSDQTPPVAALPALRAGHVTFGCFNELRKITDEMIAIWSRILHQCPNAKLLFKNQGLTDESARHHLTNQFATHGISANRLDLRRWVPSRHAHLQVYDEVDIALDTFPYHGTTTTCEAMWMGVPVISLAGDCHVSRVAVSLLSNVGLSEFLATTPAELVRIATSLADDATRLGHIRSTLRQRMEQSPLMDAQTFTKNVESAYRQIWKTWLS